MNVPNKRKAVYRSPKTTKYTEGFQYINSSSKKDTVAGKDS